MITHKIYLTVPGASSSYLLTSTYEKDFLA